MEMNQEQLWQAVLAELELTIPRANFLTWLQNTHLLMANGENGEAVVGVPNNFTKEWLEKKYHKFIFNILQNLTDNKVKKVIYQVEGTPIAISKTIPKVDLVRLGNMLPTEEPNISELNPRYTFETFIVGKGNELACAAAQAVAETPGKKYNPLFIYGGVGLGKTHLLQAIGNAILKNDARLKVLYTNAEKFTNEFVRAIRDGSMEKFKRIYRNLDVFLIDDIQFMTAKEATQEEFFHTFNALHQKDRQIVITSDRLPKTIPALEERLISRFEWGLIADVISPDMETRMAILNSKCKDRNYELSQEIIQYLASHIQKNVREIEGALSRVIAYHELNKVAPTIDSVKQIMSSLAAQPKKSLVNSKQLINAVAEFYGIKLPDLIGNSRKRELVGPRQVAMFLLREELSASFPFIGQELGNRDHTTAMHSYEKIRKELEGDGRVKQEIDYIKQRLYN